MEIPVFSYAGEYDGTEPVMRHMHRGTELLLVTRGECVIQFDDGMKLDAATGDAVITPPGIFHAQFGHVPCHTIFTVYEVTERETDSRPRRIATRHDALLENWFANLLELNRDYQAQQASLLLAVIRQRIAAFENANDNSANRHPRVREAIAEMRKNYARNLSVSELAEKIGVSHSHLNFLFHKEFGTGPLEILTSLRMRQARQLLLERRYNIAEVALKSGYQDTNYFTRIFRHYHGVTPGEFRNAPAAAADRLKTAEQNGQSF